MMDRKRVGVNVTLSYSLEAELLINATKDFDIDSFEEGFLKNIEVGSRTIVEYILIKGKEKLKEQEKENG